uniref:Uncharacterized protein n=1 Tax=Burkholderia sp. M701 TaxID=326454 RepID=V5YP16_9BURK|nr:hypothetical protein [Burkholderia sp. M701]BAO19048.1 hypothetical protein [Burkholderia sp. M701]
MSTIDVSGTTNVPGDVDMSEWNVAVEGWWYRVIGDVSINVAYSRHQGWGVDLVRGDKVMSPSSYFGESFRGAVKAAEDAYERVAVEQESASANGTDPVVSIPASILAEIIDLANAHVNDIKEGIEDHTYERGENLNLPVRLNAIETAEALYRQTTLKRS